MARQDWWLLAAADQRLVRRAQVAVRGRRCQGVMRSKNRRTVAR
jgi:hypothetical protein